MVPYTFIENDQVTAVPTVERSFPMTCGRADGQTRRGPATPEFEAEQVLPTLTRKAVEYIAQRAAAGEKRAALLSLPAVRLAAHAHRADARMARQERLESLRRFRHADRLGGGPGAGGAGPARGGRQHAGDLHQRQRLLARGQHQRTAGGGARPQRPLARGHKADIWDGGHRVPFIVRWPGKVESRHDLRPD